MTQQMPPRRAKAGLQFQVELVGALMNSLLGPGQL